MHGFLYDQLVRQHLVIQKVASGSLVVMMFATPLRAEPLQVYFETRLPYTELQEGVLMGAVGKPAMAALQQSGIPFDLRDVPFNRHMAVIEKNLGPACAVGRFKTAERMQSGKFSLPIYRDQPYVGLVRADNAKLKNLQSFQALLDIPTLRFVQREGYAYGDMLDGWFSSAGSRIIRVTDNNLSLARMVHQRMADITLLAGEEAEGLLAAMPEERADLALLRYSDAPKGALRYFFCSKQVDDVLLQKLNAAISTLK